MEKPRSAGLFCAFVIPAKAGIQGFQVPNAGALDPRLRGDDAKRQSFKFAGTLPPFCSMRFITSLWSHMFILALSFLSPV